jgi:PAS domain S-box-containing protein
MTITFDPILNALPMAAAILEHGPDECALVIVEANPALAAMTGRPACDLRNQPLNAIFEQEPGAPFPNAGVGRALAAEGFWQGTPWTRTRHGPQNPASWSLSPLAGGARPNRRYLAVCRDVAHDTSGGSDRPAAPSQSIGTLTGPLTYHAADAVIAIDASRRILVFNPAAERIFGWRAEEVLGQPIEILMPPRFREKHARYVEAFAAHAPASRLMGERSEIMGQRRDGEVFPAEASIFPVRQQGRTILATMLRDISERKAREAKLHETGQRYQALFDLSYQFVGLLAPDSRLLEANDSALSFIGTSMEEIREMPFVETPWFRNNPDAQKTIEDAIEKVRAHEFVRGEFILYSLNGEPRYFDFSIRPVFDSHGNLEYIIPEGRDISEFARTSQALARGERLLRNAQRIGHMGNWYWDLATDEVYWSEEVYQILGEDPESFVPDSTSLMALVHPDDRPEVEKILEICLNGHPGYSLDHRIVRRDGSVRAVRQVAETYVSADGEVLFLEGVVQDITSTKETEAQLIQARREAEAANDAKTQFLATMSHELRTPLNAVIGFAEILEKELLGPMGAPRYGDYAAQIRDSGEHLLSIVNDILDIARFSSSEAPLEIEPLAVPEAVANALPKLQNKARDGGVTLANRVRPNLPNIRADWRSVNQILLNLLSNAIKFTRPGGRVFVDAEALADGYVRLYIHDTGIGIPEGRIPELGQPFRRLDDAYTAGTPGTGLGLAIVKTLVTRMKGRLTIDSSPGVGTCVMVDLPLAGPESADIVSRPEPS